MQGSVTTALSCEIASATIALLYTLFCFNYFLQKITEHWMQRITFAAETNAAYSRGSADTHTLRDAERHNT